MKYECKEHEEELAALDNIIVETFERCPWCRDRFPDVPGMFIDTKGNSTFEGDVTISGDWSPLDSHG